MKKLISTRLHGIFDYIIVVALLFSPWFLEQEEAGQMDTGFWMLPFGISGMLLINALFTNFELGVIKMIPMPAHLWTDYLLGVVLIAVPLFIPSYGSGGWLLTALGILLIGIAFLTKKKSRIPDKKEIAEVSFPLFPPD